MKIAMAVLMVSMTANGFLARTDGYGDAIEIYPTHWRPLPPPPTDPEVR